MNQMTPIVMPVINQEKTFLLMGLEDQSVQNNQGVPEKNQLSISL